MLRGLSFEYRPLLGCKSSSRPHAALNFDLADSFLRCKSEVVAL